MKYKLAICIPTYNRSQHLRNCLESLYYIRQNYPDIEFQICVSDNHSGDDTELAVLEAQKKLDIKYHRNRENIGIPRNFLNVVTMADAEFVWLIGDDDLLVPSSIYELYKLFDRYKNVDFFYVNSFHLTTEYVLSFPQPFSVEDLPADMKRFSDYDKTGEIAFLGLIDPKISFDFLGGMFLAVFRKAKWEANMNLARQAIYNQPTFSHFDNTFPHVKIFSKAFASSQAYFYAEPLSICLTGAREWSPMYPFIHSVRLVEALEEYRRNGLPFLQYLKCRNFALNNFIPDLVNMILYYKISGIQFVKPLNLFFPNLLFPNTYFSLLYFIIRKLKFTFVTLTERLKRCDK